MLVISASGAGRKSAAIPHQPLAVNTHQERWKEHVRAPLSLCVCVCVKGAGWSCVLSMVHQQWLFWGSRPFSIPHSLQLSGKGAVPTSHNFLTHALSSQYADGSFEAHTSHSDALTQSSQIGTLPQPTPCYAGSSLRRGRQRNPQFLIDSWSPTGLLDA